VPSPGFALFDAAIGRCGIGWSVRGITGVQLPEPADQQTVTRLLRRMPHAVEAGPPPEIGRVVDAIVALLRGESRRLTEVTLDMDGIPVFDRRVYEITRTIPPGGTLTYGELAARIGTPGAARAVGQALGRNPFAIVVPCHRVLGAGGEVGGFSASGGPATKRRLLELEGDQLGLDWAR
jgi:methylated-DNA-[protein]-cysteine S-methyltransferase